MPNMHLKCYSNLKHNAAYALAVEIPTILRHTSELGFRILRCSYSDE